MMQSTDQERARSVLSFLDYNDEDVWIKAAQGLKSEFGEDGFDMWEDWGSQYSRYNPREAKARWKSIKPTGGVGIGSLFYDAKAAGWQDDRKKYPAPSREVIEARKAAAAQRQAEAEAQEAMARAAAADHARFMWERAQPVDGDAHPYLQRKGVQSHGLRVGAWEKIDHDSGDVRVISEQALLVPIRDARKGIHSLQAIFAGRVMGDRDKDFVTDGAKSGNFYSFGKPVSVDVQGMQRQVILFGEGYATLASAHAATGHACIVAFDAGNVPKVAAVLRERFPEAAFVFLADNDLWTEGNPGVRRAQQAAEAVGGFVAIPPFDYAEGKAGGDGKLRGPSDFNDLHALRGIDAVCEVIEAALEDGALPPRIVIAPTKDEANGVAYAHECLVRLAKFAANRRRREPAVEDDTIVLGADGDLAHVAAIARMAYPDAVINIMAAPGQDAEAQRVAELCGACVEVPPSADGWRGWGEYCLDLLFDRIDDAADVDNMTRTATGQALAQAAALTVHARDDERRRQQQEENARIQEENGAMIPAKLTLDEMLERCVWLAEGEVVAYVTPNRSQFLTYKEFRSLTAESVTLIESGEKPILTAKLWQSDQRRQGAMTRTFRAGAGVICADPEGDRAVNLWRPIVRWPAKACIDLFLDHVAYLFEDEAERSAFLDWCAHLEQKPGELPHYGWLHIASHTGCGRNWLASVLARVWRGYVAPNVDLPALLDSQYNGSIARRVLAVVDEIQEGGSGNRRHTNRLTGLLNAETRLINPKFGRQFHEFNSCRWLVFSNHTNALPIDNTDRRWRVVGHEKPPRPAGDYEKLYAALSEKEFINAVGMFFRERDISGFKPGERPPLNAAKAAVIEASKPMQTALAEDLRDHWPTDIILNDHVAEILADQPSAAYTPAMRRAMEEIGAVALDTQIKINGKARRGWILRNLKNWQGASKNDQRHEIHRAGVNSLKSASAVLADSVDGEPSF